MYALIPGVLLFVFGASRRQLGLVRPIRGSLRATLACLALPIVMCAFALWQGGITWIALAALLIHNFFSNGFSEEFVIRGMAMSHLRHYFRTEWALVGQSVLFALPHIGVTIPEMHGRIFLAFANVLALNAPIAFALGIMALRSRSLVLPTAVHVSLDTMARLTRGH